MKNRRVLSAALAAVTATALFSLAVPAQAVVTGERTVAATSATAEDGTDLFLGLFFGVGPVADELGVVLPDTLETTVEEYTANAQEVVALVKSTDPAAFDTVTADLTSGDVVRVQQGVDTGVELVRQAARDAGLVAEDGEISPQCGFAMVCVVLSVAAVQHSAAVTTVAVAAVAIAVKTGLWVSSAADFGSLDEERHLLALTDALAR